MNHNFLIKNISNMYYVRCIMKIALYLQLIKRGLRQYIQVSLFKNNS